jgi:integrase
MNKYRLYSKDFVIEKQNSLQPEKVAALEKIALRNKEIEQFGNSKIYITEEEQHLSQMQLKTQTSQNDIPIFSDEDIERIKYVIANGYRIQFTSRSGNPVTSGLYYPKQGMFFLFMLNSGIRGGEAVCLKYSDFDFEKSTVRIQQTAVNTKVRDKDGIATRARNRTFTRPKTERSYSVLQLSPYAIQIIMYMKAQEPPEYDGYVVHSDYRPISEKTLWQRLDKLLRGAGVQACGLHSLRHTHGTKLYEATQDLKIVAQQLRHTDPSFTAKTYVHQTDKRTKEILENIEI